MRKNLLLLTNEFNSGNGWATTGYEIGKYLKSFFDVTILTHRDAQNEPFSPQPLNILPNSQEYGVLNFLKVFPKVPNERIDVIFCNIERLLPFAVLLKLKFRSKLLLIGQGTYIYYPFVTSSKRQIARWFLKAADMVVVPSHHTFRKVKEFYHGRLEIIPWGVNPERFAPVEHIEQEPSFVFVGELKERKGVRYLLAAFERIQHEFPQSRLYVIGGTRTYHPGNSNIQIPENVVFIGPILDTRVLSAYYSKCVAHVLPSVNTGDSFEGFGIVHLEANACGTPTIGSLGCGNEDAIVDGVTGFLCPQKDVECLYQNMKRLLTDHALHEKMKKNALQHAELLSWQRTGGKMATLLENVLLD